MEDTLGLKKIEEKKQSTQNWRLSNESEPSRTALAGGLNRLQVIPKVLVLHFFTKGSTLFRYSSEKY